MTQFVVLCDFIKLLSHLLYAYIRIYIQVIHFARFGRFPKLNKAHDDVVVIDDDNTHKTAPKKSKVRYFYFVHFF